MGFSFTAGECTVRKAWVEALLFNFWPDKEMRKYSGYFMNGMSDEANVIALRSADLDITLRIRGGVLLEAGIGTGAKWKGRNFYIVVSPRDKFLPLMREAVVAMGELHARSTAG